MKKTKNILCLWALVFSTFSVGVFAQADDSAPRPEKEWTFLLFLNGHNNLSYYGHMNIQDMEKSGSTDQVNYVVEWGNESSVTQRMLIQKSTNPNEVTSPALMSLPNHDMGDYKNLVDFVKWGVKEFPAKHYFVAVWNHGTGWHELRDLGLIKPNEISYDDNTGNKISTEQLGLAMSEIKDSLGRKIDIYGSDACLMQMIEVAAEMKDSVNYFVGSQDLEPGEGWPYETIMKSWGANPQMSPQQVATMLSKEYAKAYSTGGVYRPQSITMSALDLSHLDPIIELTTKLAAHLESMPVESLSVVKNDLYNVQNFYYSDYADFGDFLKRFKGLSIQKDVGLVESLQSEIKSLVLTSDNTGSFANATGVSIWIPSYQSSDMARYQGLMFDKQTGWSKFLNKMLGSN